MNKDEQLKAWKSVRKEPIPTEKVVPDKRKDPKKDRRKTKQDLNRGNFDE